MEYEKLTELEKRQWYEKAVGIIGIQPSELSNMTTEQINLAYKGYLQRQEDTVNLMLLALLHSRSSNKTELIKFVEKNGISFGNIEEREKTFQNLKIGGLEWEEIS